MRRSSHLQSASARRKYHFERKCGRLLTFYSYNLEDVFDVIVGDPSTPVSKRFTLHTSVFVTRSGFLAATRKPEWVAQNPGRPVDLHDEDPELFQAYMNCVYFGFETIKPWVDSFKFPTQEETSADDGPTAQDSLFTKLISLYLLCQKLVDLETANMVIDEIVRFGGKAWSIPLLAPTSLAYSTTVKHDPLRALVRDYWMYESSNVERQALRADDFPAECLVDIALATLERFDGVPLDRADLAMSVRTLCLVDKCRYHLHDDKNPQCGVKAERDGL